MFYTAMQTRHARLLYVPMIAAALVAGVAMEAAVDPYEGTGIAALGLVVGALVAGGVGSYWYKRRVAMMDGPDERLQKIELRASRQSHGLLTLGVAGIAAVPSFTFYDGPVTTALWVLLAGSILVHELSIEFYRRQM